MVGEKAVTLNGGTGNTTVGEFLASIQGLVARKSTLFTGQGSPTAQNIRENYDAGLDAMTRLAEEQNPGEPQAVDRYRGFYIQQAGQTLEAARMTYRANREILQQRLIGPNGAKSWSEFLSDPKLAQAYTDTVREDPGASSRVDNMISANALGKWDSACQRKDERSAG